MVSIVRFLIRSSAFVGKELVEVLRQTPLILTLVLGPFLIMLLFGIGYRNQARPLRTLFVVQENPQLKQQVESFAENLGPSLVYQGIEPDTNQAMRSLESGLVDLVVVIPPDSAEIIRKNQQAVISLYHNEIDPAQVGYIEYFGRTYIDEINRRLLQSAAQQGQMEASTALEKVKSARSATQATRQALEAGDVQAAQNKKQLLDNDLDSVSLLMQTSLGLLGGVGAAMDEDGGNPDADAVQASLTSIDQNREDLGEISPGQAGYRTQIDELHAIETDLISLETHLADFQSIEPRILVAPFTSEVIGIEDIKITPADFFAPAVVVLLLQHLAVTFGALAIVREQRSGSMELFHISPLSSLETLIGKYLSYLLFGGLLAGMITATIVFVLKVPVSGRWLDYAQVILVLLFTSLGMGFLISLIAKTDLQAVQYAMFMLLGSVFFSGFILDLRYLWQPVRAVSWGLPATYGIRLLQDIMLRGAPPSANLVLALFSIGVGLFILSWFLLRRRLQQEWS